MPSAQHVLLAIIIKRTDNVELKEPVLNYIKQVYSDREAEDAADDLDAIQKMRNDIVIAQNGAQATQRDSLTKYFRALTAIETRFPISSDKGSVRVSFPWYDAFRPRMKTSQANIHLEKSGILFNVAAILSQQALQVERGSGEGIKQACSLFSEAAGTFAYLKANEANRVDNPRPVDLSAECCTMLERLMLAQAQECVYHKGAMDKKSPAVLARLAKQAFVMYNEVTSLFQQPALSNHFEKSWAAHTQMKGSLYDVDSLVQQGRQYNSETKVAQEVAVLQEAFSRFQATKKLAKAISSDMADSLKGYEEMLQLALTKARNDNNTVYLERVPPFADLPPVQPALLVKAVTPQGLDASGETYFSGLVPDNSAKALSKYTDMVDGVSRELLDKLAGATDAARVKLRELELPEMLEALDGASHAAVPDALLHDLEGVQGTGGVQHLREILSEIGDLRQHVEQDIMACQASLDEEASADAECRSRYGDKWNVPLSATLAKHLWDKLSSYRTTMAQAAESDSKVIARLNDSEGALMSLTPDQAASLMPRLQAPMVTLGGDEPAVVVARLRRNLEALNQLSSERAGLEEVLKDTKQKDNILPKLMASTAAQFDALFSRELAKYDALRADVAKNVDNNNRMLAALAADAAAFKTVFDVGGWRQACDQAAAGMKANLKTYREVLDHLSEGLRFYMSLQEAIKQHQQQCSDYAYTRALQRDDLKQELERRTRDEREKAASAAQQMSYMSLTPPSGNGPAYPPHPQQTPHQARPPPPPQAHAYAQYYQQNQAPGLQSSSSFGGQHAQPPPPPQFGHPQGQQGYQGGYAPQVQQPYHGGGYGAPPGPPQYNYGAPPTAPNPYQYQQPGQQQQPQQQHYAGAFPQQQAPPLQGGPYQYPQQGQQQYHTGF